MIQNLVSFGGEAIHPSNSEAEAEVTRCIDEASPTVEKAEKHQTALTLIHRLPPELLALVFSFFCTVDFWNRKAFASKHNSRVNGSIFRESFIIATVCSRWRSIAVSTPSLWSTIMLGGGDIQFSREDSVKYCSEGFSESFVFPEDVLDVILERSAQYPLKFWIQSDCDSYWPFIFTTKLRQVCSRIEQIYLEGNIDPFYGTDSESPNLVFDQLSVLQLCPDRNDEKIDPFPWLSTATNLRILVFQDPCGTFDGMGPEFWTSMRQPMQTRFLFIEDKTMEIIRATSIFSKFPNTVSSGLMCEYSDYDYIDGFSCESLQALGHFSIDIRCFQRQCAISASSPDSESCNCFANLFSSLTLPALKSLSIQGDPSYSRPQCWSQPYFSEFLDRSVIKQSLTRLSIHNIDGLDDDELVNLFHSVPFLTHLTICAFNQKPIISIAMPEQLASSPLLPCLEFLGVQIDQTEDSNDAVLHLVAARTPSKGQLQEISVYMDMKEFPESVERVKDGLERFSGIRHSIFEARSYFGHPLFEYWMDDVRELDLISL
ncbi:hypothetical protein C8J56DRAFT_965040 [Mycena floridula]|nr:hypothetical protein C8J56DRAFT_965040 [Mycena floridula]